MKVTNFIADFLSEKKQFREELKKAKFPVLRNYFSAPLLTPLYLLFWVTFQ